MSACPVCAKEPVACDCGSATLAAVGAREFMDLRRKSRVELGMRHRSEIVRAGGEVDELMVDRWVVTRGTRQWMYWPRTEKFKTCGDGLIFRGLGKLVFEIGREARNGAVGRY